MQNALGLMQDQAIMFSIMVALGVGGIFALFMALFWPTRWRVPYRMEVWFAVIIAALGVYGDLNSSAAFRAYQADVPDVEGAASGKVLASIGKDKFDRVVTVYAFQWGFLFLDADGNVVRNAVAVEPGERILFHILTNDVIHGFQIPAVGLTTEVDPGAVRSVWIRAPKTPGKYLIQCVDFCGLGHHQMKAWLVVGDPGENGEDNKPLG